MTQFNAPNPQSSPPPMPVLPAWPTEPPRWEVVGRPALIKTIAVLSIVFGSIGILANVFAAIYALIFTFVVAVAGSAATTSSGGTVAYSYNSSTSPTVQVAPAKANGEYDPQLIPVRPRGLAPPQRANVASAFSRARPLNAERLNRLDQLLAKCGQDILPMANDRSVAIETLRQNISDSGVYPTADASGAGMEWFVVGQGKLEIADDHAAFFPSDGSETQRVTKTVIDDGEDDVEPATPNSRYNSAQPIIARINSISPSALNLMQRLKVEELLSQPSYAPLMTSSSRNAVQQAVQSVEMSADGWVQIQFADRWIRMDSSGTVVAESMGMSNQSLASAHGVAAAPPVVAPVSTRTAATITLAETALSMVLTIMLLTGGILLLRGSTKGRTFHLIYAWMKVPTAILMVVGWSWLILSLNSSFKKSIGGGPSWSQAGVYTFAAVFGIVSLIYPITLLILMNLKAARDHQNTLRGHGSPP